MKMVPAAFFKEAIWTCIRRITNLHFSGSGKSQKTKLSASPPRWIFHYILVYGYKVIMRS